MKEEYAMKNKLPLCSLLAFFIATAVASILSACAGDEQAPTLDQKLASTAWTPIFLEGRGDAKMPDAKIDGEEAAVFLQFSPDAKRINGMSGDNLFGGEAIISANGNFKTDKVFSTRRMGPYSRYESAFLAALNSADSIELRNGALVLKKGGKTLIEFESREPKK